MSQAKEKRPRSSTRACLDTREDRKKLISSVCSNLQTKLGLQADSVLNQAEHVEALWQSFIMRHNDPQMALQDLRGQLLRTTEQWWEKVWQPFTGSPPLTMADYDPLLDVCLFMLLWGELGNLRFCPELGCFLFAAARCHCSSRHGGTAAAQAGTKIVYLPIEVKGKTVLVQEADSKWRLTNKDLQSKSPSLAYRLTKNVDDKDKDHQGPKYETVVHGHDEGDGWLRCDLTATSAKFLDELVKPIFKVVMEETFDVPEGGGAPKFKFGNAPAPAKACNYDDWNELFWDAHKLRRYLKLKDRSCLYTQRISAADVWTRLPDVDWALSFARQKSHLELHSMLPLFVGHYRPFMMLSVFFTAMIMAWTNDLTDWYVKAIVGLIPPLWLTFYELGYQALTPTIPFCDRLRGILKMVCVYWLPLYTFAPVLARETMADELGPFFSTIPVQVYFGVHCGVSALVFLFGLKPKRYGLYNSNFYPVLSRQTVWSTVAFWIVAVALKLLLDLVVTQGCSISLLQISKHHRQLKNLPSLVTGQIVVLLVPAVLSVVASMSFFANFLIALVGAATGIHQLGGVKLFWNRRGVGFTRVPQTVTSRVLQIPQERPEGLGFFEALHWWNRMSDRELEAFVETWSEMIKELREADMISDKEFQTLIFKSAAETREGPPNLPRLLDPAGIFHMSEKLPSNKEATRRILALARSAQMWPLPAAKVREMPHLSIVIPHYSETILYERKDLFNAGLGGSTDVLKFLVQYYKDEFQNFSERVWETHGLGAARADSTRAAANIEEGLQDLEEALCKWTSLRMQTLWRTVAGICRAYSQALALCLKQQEPNLEKHEREELVRNKIQVVVAVQQYAKFQNPDDKAFDIHMVAAVEAMLVAFGDWLSIAYIDERKTPEGTRYYSCMIDATCPLKPGIGAREPKYTVELPGFPILGNGKSDNQNCAVIYTRGEILQMIDANQDAYFESALFLPMALQEFNSTRNGRRPGILGFREHIFSNIGLPGRLAADSEFAFGTIIQRTMDWPLEARLHYGHPDMLDKLQMLQQGGVSKATRGLNLSEDVFAGIDLTLRGGWTKYREYFHVGKGRDMGFMSVMSFNAKVSMGNGEQATTRQWMRMGLGLPFSRLLGVFYMHVGYYLNQVIVNWSMKAFAFMAAFFTLSNEIDPKFSKPAETLTADYFGLFYLMFVLASMLPLLLEVQLENGFRASFRSIASSLLGLSPIFAAFQSKLIGYFFETTVNFGGAQYIPTGRGLATTRMPFVQLVRTFGPSHMNDALETTLFLGVSIGVYYGATFYICIGLSIFSWMIAPFLFNPKQFESCQVNCTDFNIWRRWMGNGDTESDSKSWVAWSIKAQQIRKNSSVLWIVIPSIRLMGLVLTMVLVSEVVKWPDRFARDAEFYWTLLAWSPPLAFPALCLLLGLLQSTGLFEYLQAKCLCECNYYMLTSILAVGLTSFESYALYQHPTSTRHLCIWFNKYMWLRFGLEAADGFCAHRPCGCVLGAWHNSCRIFAFSWRFMRDLFLGVFLSTVCFLIACIPFISKLHTLFLFRTVPEEEAKARELEQSGFLSLHAEDVLREFVQKFGARSDAAATRRYEEQQRVDGAATRRKPIDPFTTVSIPSGTESASPSISEIQDSFPECAEDIYDDDRSSLRTPLTAPAAPDAKVEGKKKKKKASAGGT